MRTSRRPRHRFAPAVHWICCPDGRGGTEYHPYPVHRHRARVRSLLGLMGDVREAYAGNLERATRAGLPPLVAESREDLGVLAWRMSRFDDALGEYRLAREAYLSLGDESGANRITANVGTVHHYRGDLEKAKDFYRQAIESALARGDSHLLCRVMNDLASLHQYRGELDRAMELLRQCQDICAGLQSPLLTVQTTGNLAIVLQHQGDLGRAKSCLLECAAISRRLGLRNYLGLTMGNLGIVNALMGDFEEAVSCLGDQLDIARVIGDKRGACLAVGNLANVYADLGEYQLSLERNREWRRLALDMGDQRQAWLALGNTAGVLVRLGRLRESLDLYAEAVAACERMDLKANLCEFLHGRARALMELGETAGAAGDNERAGALARELGRGDILSSASVLGELIQGAADPSRSLARLEAMLGPGTDPGARAEILQAMFLLSGNEAHRLRAIDSYREAYALKPLAAYREEMAKLGTSGGPPPGPPATG